MYAYTYTHSIHGMVWLGTHWQSLACVWSILHHSTTSMINYYDMLWWCHVNKSSKCARAALAFAWQETMSMTRNRHVTNTVKNSFQSPPRKCLADINSAHHNTMVVIYTDQSYMFGARAVCVSTRSLHTLGWHVHDNPALPPSSPPPPSASLVRQIFGAGAQL